MTHEWAKKLDDKGLKLIEATARLQSLGPQPPFSDHQSCAEWLTQNKQIQASYPELVDRRRIRVTPEFVKFFRRHVLEGDQEFSARELVSLFAEEIWPSSMATSLEAAERLWRMFENDPKERARAYVMIGAGLPAFGSMLTDMKERQFGKAVKGDRQPFIVMAQVLKWIGGVLRGRAEMPRGRVNVDLAKVVNAILKHQKEKLTQQELYEAVKEAGAELPEDPEAFRLWLHRARKSGLVTAWDPNP